MNLIKEDLEVLTGSLIRGSLTPIVYNILKDSPYKADILEYKELISKERRERVNVSEQENGTDTGDKADSRTSFEEWLARIGKPVSL